MFIPHQAMKRLRSSRNKNQRSVDIRYKRTKCAGKDPTFRCLPSDFSIQRRYLLTLTLTSGISRTFEPAFFACVGNHKDDIRYFAPKLAIVVIRF